MEKITFDLRQLDAIPDLISSLGRVDVLVNNAGVLFCPPPDGLADGDLGFTAAQRSEILTVNLLAPCALIEAVAPQMISRGRPGADPCIGGRIVNVASVSGFTGHPDLWYGASKAALLNATKSWAKLLGGHSVLINAVAPGPTLSVMYDKLPQERKDFFSQNAVSKRPAQPSEVAEAVLWLGSRSPEYTNGTCLDVNGMCYPR